MSYHATRSRRPARHAKKKGFFARVLGAFGDSQSSDGTCFDWLGVQTPCPSTIDVSNPTYDQPGGSAPTSTSSTTQDTTVLPDGSVVGGQATGTPTAPVGQWKNVGGVCYATNGPFLGAIKELQRQLNRALSPKVIAVDGSVGPTTLGAVGAVAGLGAYKTLANPSSASCDAVCSNIYAFTAATQQYADGKSAPSSVSSPAPVATPQVWNPISGKLENQGLAGSVGDMWGNLSSTEQAMAVAGVAAVGYWAWTDSKKLRRKG